MPIGPFGEILGTTGTMDSLSKSAQNYKSRVVAPRNPKLIKGEQEPFKMKPSQFLFQMCLDTEKKLANQHTMSVPKKIELLDMTETSHQKTSNVSIDEPMFQPFPSEVFFQNFKPFETYEVPFTLRNGDKVPRLVKVIQAESPYFKIISPHNVGHKVGPGLPTTFKIQFTPEEVKDYYHELLCITEREKFVVPVRAIGARAILDFADEVHFPPGPVKYTNSRTLLIRNIGNREAKFTLSTKKPFTVTPENGVLPVNESMQINLEMKATTVGEHIEDLVLHYDTGEYVYINLYGVAQDAHVRLDKNSIRIENTYISMANQRTVIISNRSDVIAHFRWTQFATQEEEDQQKFFFVGNLSKEQDSEKDRFLEECISDPSLRDKMSILSRTFENRKRLVEGDQMFFTDDVFKIEPVEGDIWPNSTVEVNVIFKPTEARTYTCTAFCDITGRETRLPLRMRGDGCGPKVQFSFDELNMGNIFVNSTHTYEVVVANKGDIDSIFSLISSNSVFGPHFIFNPSEGIVMPDGHQAIQVTFRSHILGEFHEDFFFQIDGSPEKLKLTFKGCVIGPTFHFDVPKIKFGTVSYGFLNTQTCTLTNTALVPMTFELRVRGDGIGDSITSLSEYDSTVSEAGSNFPLKEFQLTPSSGTIPAQSEIKVKVDFCSNTLKKYDLILVVDVDGVGEEIVSLPIQAKCVVPNITVLTPILDYGRCFLHHPYEHNIKLQNDTDLPAKYEILPQQVDEFSPITFSSPQSKGIIEPHSILDVPVVITPQSLEELEVAAHVLIFGSPEPPLLVLLTCVGEGPVVHITPMSIDWGQVNVLTDISKTITLSNESLIPAKFQATMVRPNSVWHVEPSMGEIAPERQIQLIVTACLDDCVRFQDKLQINIEDGPSRFLPVTAYGFGTTVVTDPPMVPSLNLGPHFSKGPCKRTFKLTNKGRRHQSLVWGTEGFTFNKPKRPGGLQPINPKDMRYKDMPPPPDTPRPVFHLTPHRMELLPGESIDVELEGSVEEPRLVKERMACHAIIGRAGGKELIMKVAVQCEFISPLLEFSTDKIHFRVDKGPSEELSLQTKNLVLTNVSSLPLTALLSLTYPFQLIINGDEEVSQADVKLGIGESTTVNIQFNPAYKEDFHIRTIDDVLTVSYLEHPHKDEITLQGEVYFPNLQFEKQIVDFGCILNDTEVTRYINITNNSPMEVNYKWSFLVDDSPMVFHHKRPTPPPSEPMEVEEMDGHEGYVDNLQLESPIHVDINIELATSPRVSEDGEVITERTEKELMLAESDGEEKKDPEKPDNDNTGDCDIYEDKNLADHLSLDSRPVSRGETPIPEPAVNPVLAALLQQDRQRSPLGVEEIFDILPLYGTLKPGETEQVTLTFFGHSDIGGRALAVCDVEGGPTYEVELKGEASLVQYSFDCLHIDYGKQMYDQVATAEIVLANTGLVGFEFVALGMDAGMASKPKPGCPVLIPHTGFIEANSQQVLQVKFLPGVPDKFNKSFPIQVAHFEPDCVNLFGEGVFPRVSLDLPRIVDKEGKYESLVTKAKENLLAERRQHVRPMSAASMQGVRGRIEDDFTHPSESAPSELEVQMEVERLVVAEFAQEFSASQEKADVLEVHSQKDINKKSLRKKGKPRSKLPEYLLDFGHVVLGTVRTHIVRATNTGWFPVSFSVGRDGLVSTGFNVELDKVKQLPGAPDHETVDFVISFDPRGANLGLGPSDTTIPLNLVGGPQVMLRVHANVTMPDMQISTDMLDFEEVRCGECKVITVQLHNHKHVRCEWNSLPSDKDKKKVDKHVPMHLRRKMRQQERAKPRAFEMMPATGVLLPGQRQNVQVKFMPTEEKFYEQRIALRLSQSSQRILLLCRGLGAEPHIEFESNLVEFGPVLPHSNGDEQDIIVRNPCKFPIEVYNLEFDKGYLEEEKILRLMKGYDEYNTILLPPRLSGEKLPPELLDYYEEQMKKLEEAEQARREAEEAAEATRREQEEREVGEHEQAGSEAKDADDSLTPTAAPAAGSTSRQEGEIDGPKTDRSGAAEGDKDPKKKKVPTATLR